jgi:hypothetical protein
MYSAEPLPHFVDEYLSYLYEVHPTNATFDGVHLHDDLLEDWSRQSIEAQIRDLGGFARRLAAIDPARLTDTERIERPALDASIRARLFDLEEVRPWERNPQHYADVLATSLAGQALFDYAPLAERARRVLSKLRQVPRFIQAARDNIKDPPGIFIKVGLESMRGTLRFIDEDLPRAFGDLGDLHLLGDLADASTEAAAAIGAYIEYLERDLAPRTKGSFRLGRDRFEQKLRLDEGIALDADRLLAIATRELQHTQEDSVAWRLVSTAATRWRRGREPRMTIHRPVNSSRSRSSSWPTWSSSSPDSESSRFPRELQSKSSRRRASTAGRLPACGRRDPLNRVRCAPSTISPTSNRRGRPSGRRSISATSATARSGRSRCTKCFPGHFLHYQHLRQVDAKLRKSILFSSTALVEGWAHYCEQMMIEEGFRKNDHAVRLGQLAEALIRLCRFIVGIRLHCEDMSVEQGVRVFPRRGVPRRSERAA